MHPIVSIIIPVYNVEMYLEECINSIINQTYTYLDIILVNDGSTDLSGYICDKFKNDDTRIKVIHKKNGGLSHARNKGMEKVEGKYVLFVDSDDYLESNAIEILVRQAEIDNLDVIEFNARKFWVNGKQELVHKRRMHLLDKVIMNGADYYLKSIEYDCFTAAACFKLIRRDLLEKNHLLFKEKHLHEDELWAPQLMLLTERICYLNYPLYNYRMREESITLKKERTNNVLCYMQNCMDLKKIFEENVVDNVKKKEMLDYIARQYMAAVTIGNFSWKKINEHIVRTFPLINAKKMRTKLATIVYFFSPKVYYYLLQFLKKII